MELMQAPDGVHVRDLESRNGTYHLDQRIDRTYLGRLIAKRGSK
jgi:hypothetical protein